jgi:hypothetical protein
MDLKHVNEGCETEASNVHNSLLEVAMSILGKMILNHFLDASSELLPREIE